MKRNMFMLVMILAIAGSVNLNAQVKTEKFKVYGNCGMCETRIEKAVTKMEGVSAADWDKETKMIEVTFDTEKTTLDKIHKTIADVGHDTKLYKAKDEVYDALPGCCKYEREE